VNEWNGEDCVQRTRSREGTRRKLMAAGVMAAAVAAAGNNSGGGTVKTA